MNYIKLNNWKTVKFPDLCPQTGNKADTVKEYDVDNTSFLWWLLRIVVRLGQYIVIPVPFSSEGKKSLRKIYWKAGLKGLLFGTIIAVFLLVLGVFIAVVGNTKQIETLAITISGTLFILALFLGPTLTIYRLKLKSAPLYFRVNGKQLWVRVRDAEYREKFMALNQDQIISSGA